MLARQPKGERSHRVVLLLLRSAPDRDERRARLRSRVAGSRARCESSARAAIAGAGAVQARRRGPPTRRVPKVPRARPESDQTWRSCTDTTPSTAAMARPISGSDRCSGTPAMSPCRASRRRRRLETTSRAPIRSESSGSMGVQPVQRITSPATSAATDPSRSPRTCSNAARMLRFLPPRWSSQATSRLIPKPDDGGRRDRFAQDGLRRPQALDRREGKPDDEREQTQTVDQGGEELHAPETVGMETRRCALGHPRGCRGERQGIQRR